MAKQGFKKGLDEQCILNGRRVLWNFEEWCVKGS